MSLPPEVTIIEVGARDGLQNEAKAVSANVKIDLIARLVDAGLSVVEAGAFVSPKWVPQMADSEEVLTGLTAHAGVKYPVLVPNLQGLARAAAAGAKDIGVFISASESFSQKNTNCSIAESIERFTPVVAEAKAQGMGVRGYVSVVLGCPYEGDIDPGYVSELSGILQEMGCDGVSLGDTVGVGTPAKAGALIDRVAQDVPLGIIGIHFHDTYGQALANTLACLEKGVTVIDSSIAGLGGCPYAPGAAGNVATEDVLYMLDGLGVKTGVDMDKLIDAGLFISDYLGRPPVSKVAQALSAKRAA
jgi:hydroxymethylglutaryl-CoA lyase